MFKIQKKEPVPGTDGRLIDRIICYACGHPGHFVDFCPETKTGQSHQQQGSITSAQSENEED